MKIEALEVFVIGDGPEIDPDKGGIEPLACVRLRIADGPTGLAEVFRVPPEVVRAVVGDRDTFFGRLLIGQELTHPERLWQHVWNSLVHTNRRGWEIIILGALDVAIWDAYGQAIGQPVWKLLGGVERGAFHSHSNTPRDHVVPYCTLVSDEWGGTKMIAQQCERAERLAALGYRAFKFEPMMSSPKDVIEMARSGRQVVGADAAMAIDVGYLFHDVPTAAGVCRAIEPFEPVFFETPFPVDSPEPYARLSRLTSLPLAMGEHGVTRWEFLDMMDRGGVSVVQPYMTTCGGLTEAKRIVELALARGAQVCPGNWSTQILGAATVHLAAWSPITPYIEFSPAEVFDSPLRLALQKAGFPIRSGRIAVPDSPGIGYKLPPEIERDFGM